ncbi:MAG: hypothetical protein AB2A00_39995 [Myxococcota bacterium]
MSDAEWEDDERVLFVFKKQLLVAKLSNRPGPVTPTVQTEDGPAPPTCAYASGQCFSVEWEPDLRRILGRCTNFEQLMLRLEQMKYRLEEEAPRYRRKPFYRL